MSNGNDKIKILMEDCEALAFDYKIDDDDQETQALIDAMFDVLKKEGISNTQHLLQHCVSYCVNMLYLDNDKYACADDWWGGHKTGFFEAFKYMRKFGKPENEKEAYNHYLKVFHEMWE